MAQDGFLIIDGINESATQEKMILTKVKLAGAQSYVVKKEARCYFRLTPECSDCAKRI
jgi:hypothetical protein